jgi:N4-gp56 family major capsid protein
VAFSPASILTSGALPNLVAIYYERQAIPNLKAQTPFLSMTKQKPLPMRSGNQIQFFTYSLLAANTNQASEGTVGSPITESSTKIIATIGQYADFINASDLSMDVAIDDPSLLQNLATELNYRLALTLNSLVQLTSDAATGVDSTVNIQLANGSYLTVNNIRTAVQQLVGVNARPLTKDGYYGGIIHPTVVHDLLNDTSFNGLTDILKRGGDAMVNKLIAPLSNDEVVEFAGCRFKQTTTAPSVTISSNLYYNTYIYADDALFSVFLGKNPESGERNYKLMVQEAPAQGSVSDPARQIGGWVSYNVRYTNTLRPGSTMVIRRLQSETSAS